MQIVDAALRQIIQLFPHALQRARKGIGIHQGPQQMVTPAPLGIALPRAVHLFQGLGPLLKAAKEHAAEILPGLPVTVIELQIQPAQLFGMPVKALLKLYFPFLFLHSL